MRTMNGSLQRDWKLLEAEIKHLREMMLQHDKLTELAISKSEANYNERFQKNNEFREQLKDMIATLARQKEVEAADDALHNRIEQDKKAANDKFELAFKTVNEKIDTQGNHILEGLAAAKKELGDKKDAAIKMVEDKIGAEIKTKDDKFANVDLQMKTLIDSNAEVSNKGINDLVKSIIEINRWRDNSDGRMFIINRLVGILISIVVAVVIALIITILK